MKRFTQNDIVYYQFTAWPDLAHGIFTRHGGVSPAPWASLNTGGTVGDDAEAVRHNHRLMYETLNVKAERASTVWQVHGADVVLVDGPVRNRRWIALADAMVTNRTNTPLVMRYADCTPLLFHDPVCGVIGIAHAGWRGTVLGVGSKVIKTMAQAYGCSPANIQVGIGPSIGPRRYQVGEEVVAEVRAYFGTIEGLIRRDPDDGTAYLDLWAANTLDLKRTGVTQIDVSKICTAENTQDFYSHRAEKGRTGRFGAVIAL